MLANTNKIIYYNTIGVETGQLVCPYDTDSEDEDEDKNKDNDKDKDKKIKVIRHWCINCDCIWKNLRVSKEDKCYYNINPFTYEYNVNTEEEINKFLNRFNNFAKYNKIYSEIENMIIANYNYKQTVKL